MQNVLDKSNDVFIIGIKGAAMSNLAIIMSQMGKKVSGCDEGDEFITDNAIKSTGITVFTGFEEKNLSPETDLVVYSAAHNGSTNPLVIAAKKRGIKAISQAKLLGELLRLFKTSIAISGCHGKTTTTSLLSYALMKLDVSPSYMVGVPSFAGMPGGALNKKDYFVVEADEYGEDPPRDKTPKLLSLHPKYIICTNIDFDHPDVYDTIDETKRTFLQFFNNASLFLCADDENIRSILHKLKRDQYETFGFSPDADLHIEKAAFTQTQSRFSLVYKGKHLGQFTISLFGEKNVSNAAGVILALIHLGFNADKIRLAIQDFSQVKRRFELVYKQNETYLYDDYGHHPHEIEATIAAVRLRFPHKRLIIIFQPHTFSRTKSLLKEFAQALSQANQSFVLPIFASAREDSSKFSVTSQNIVNVNTKGNIECIDRSQSINRLRSLIKKGDVIFTMGAGDVYKLKDDIINLIDEIK
jgi:UDP-N-acetylmuramate--alanine ligase